MRRLAVFIIAGVLVLAAAKVFAQKGSDPITQGDFAVLLASHLNKPAPAGGWDPASATAFLAGIGLTPVSGTWNASSGLMEGDLTHILRLMGLTYYSPEPNSTVTWARAEAVLNRFNDFLNRYNLTARTTDGSTTTHIYTGIASTSSAAPAPASPTTPH